MSLIKKIVGVFGYCAFLVISVVVPLEVVFRILPTSDSLETKPINAENRILRFKENRDVTKQIGFNFKHVNVKHINNFGFATDVDFKEPRKQNKQVVVVIGDSYVEALQVKNSNAFHALVDQELHDYDVYPIGVSGSPLSQYIAFARYAGENFNPAIYVFLIVGNDFDESFYDVKMTPGFHYFKENGSLELVEYNPSYLKKIARKSALMRYLHLDLKVTSQINRLYAKSVIPKKILQILFIQILMRLFYSRGGHYCNVYDEYQKAIRNIKNNFIVRW